MVKVISTNATPHQQLVDWTKLEKRHQQAMKDNPSWETFGGTVYIDNRSYQVVDIPSGRSA